MRSLRTAFFIAYKSIVRGQKWTLVLMVLILSLSFFNMMFTPGIFSGLMNTITQLEINTATSDISITPQQTPVPKQYIGNQRELQARIQTIPGVIGTTRTYLTAASISYDKNKNGVYKTVSSQIIGITPSKAKKVLTIDKYIVAGKPLVNTDTNQILLSAALAGGYNLPVPTDLGGVRVGDKVNIVYANGVSRKYTVKGIVKIIFGTALSDTYITTKEAESVLSTSNEASQILVKTDLNRASLSYYKERIQSLAPRLRVQMYTELLAALQSMLNAFTLIAFIVSMISVLVATVTVFVMIYINALDKRKQIGILKAIGMKERIIVYSYMFQSIFYVLCGVGVGLLIVFFVAVPLLHHYPIQLPFGPLVVSFGSALTIKSVIIFIIAGLFAGAIPARIVAREKILDALWG